MRVSNDENAVFVSGTLGGAPELSHSLYGEDFYSAELLVPRLSGTMDHVPLTIPGRNLAFMPDEGDRLSVWGQLRTYNRHTEQGTHLCVTVFAKGIEPLGEDFSISIYNIKRNGRLESVFGQVYCLRIFFI